MATSLHVYLPAQPMEEPRKAARFAFVYRRASAWSTGCQSYTQVNCVTSLARAFCSTRRFPSKWAPTLHWLFVCRQRRIAPRAYWFAPALRHFEPGNCPVNQLRSTELPWSSSALIFYDW